jgi:hypothetical protein
MVVDRPRRRRPPAAISSVAVATVEGDLVVRTATTSIPSTRAPPSAPATDVSRGRVRSGRHWRETDETDLNGVRHTLSDEPRGAAP